MCFWPRGPRPRRPRRRRSRRARTSAGGSTAASEPRTANLRAKIMDFRGLDSSIILILGGGIPRPVGNFPESLSQAI